MKKTALLLIVLLGAGLGSPMEAYSQLTGGTVSGIVRDPAGEVIVGAKVTLAHRGTNQTRSSVTDNGGFYRLPALAVGPYEVTVEADRFNKAVKQLTLRVNEDARVDIELSVAGSSETVNVVGTTAPLTESSNSVLGIVIENKQIAELPLNGRNFLQLGTLVANVNSTASLKGGSEGGILNGPFAVSGQRDRSLTFLVDGVDNNNSLSNSLSAQVSIDAIQEFKMITNLGSAEFGHHSGGLLNIVTKSGSNEFHMSVFEFFRNNKLNSPNFLEQLADHPASQFQNSQFGGTVGGPLFKDRTFYFASYEGQRLRAASVQFSNVPTEQERQGIFKNPLTGAPVQVPVDPVSARILEVYVPRPNTEQQELGNYLARPVIRSRNDFGMIRIDHLLTGDDAINGRYFTSDNYTLNPVKTNVFLSSVLPPTVPGFGLVESNRTHNAAVSYSHNFSAQTINELRFGYNRHFSFLDPQDTFRPSDLGFKHVTSPSGLFGITLPGITRLGNNTLFPIHHTMGNYHVSDSLAFMRGRHALKVGGEWRLIRQYHSLSTPGNGELLFTGAITRIGPMADFIAGAPALGFLTTRIFDTPSRQTNLGFFVQDDYQVTRRLVLNMGLRYELSTVLSSPTHKLINYSIARGFFTPGLDTDTGLYRGDHNDFAPRVGFAYTLTADGRTVVRGGYGLFYDQLAHTMAVGLNLNRTERNPTWLVGSVPPRGVGVMSALFDPATLITSLGADVPRSYDQGLRTPYAQHFNLTIQRELGGSALISFGYVGTKTTKLFRIRDINQAIFLPGNGPNGLPLSTSGNVTARRPTQLFKLTNTPVASITHHETASSAVYHSLQATFTRRLSKGLSVMSAYTWSKSLDDATDPVGFTGDTGGPQNSHDLRPERALSVFDIRHRFTAGYTYQLPFQGGHWKEGWEVHGITTLQSGQPFTPVLGFDPSLTGSQNARPHFVPGAFIQKEGQLFFNPNLPLDPVRGIPTVLIPKPGEFGTLGRNTFFGDSYKNVDVSIIKNTRFKERFTMQVRAEVFNVVNTTNLALPVRRMTDEFFGLSRRTQDVAGGVPGIGGGGPRVVQLAVKLIY